MIIESHRFLTAPHHDDAATPGKDRFQQAPPRIEHALAKNDKLIPLSKDIIGSIYVSI